MWVDKKTVKGSFWAGAYDTTFSKETIPVDESSCKKMVDFKLCGPDSNEMKTLGNVSSFILKTRLERALGSPLKNIQL